MFLSAWKSLIVCPPLKTCQNPFKYSLILFNKFLNLNFFLTCHCSHEKSGAVCINQWDWHLLRFCKGGRLCLLHILIQLVINRILRWWYDWIGSYIVDQQQWQRWRWLFQMETGNTGCFTGIWTWTTYCFIVHRRYHRKNITYSLFNL